MQHYYPQVNGRKLPLGFVDLGLPPIDADLAAIADAGEEPEGSSYLTGPGMPDPDHYYYTGPDANGRGGEWKER